ncbi:MAG: hypothetical protein Q8P52_01600 [bacterium]|nr:hypothetical protein [bacterium]
MAFFKGNSMRNAKKIVSVVLLVIILLVTVLAVFKNRNNADDSAIKDDLGAFVKEGIR